MEKSKDVYIYIYSIFLGLLYFGEIGMATAAGGIEPINAEKLRK
jgi:hypothetical protein